MNIILSWGFLSALVIFISGWPYMWAIYTREIKKPVLSTLGIWVVLGYFLLDASSENGATLENTKFAIWFGFINPVIIFALALSHGRKYGEWSWEKIDTYCTILFIFTFVLWKTLDLPIVGLLGLIVSDAIAAIPMIVKAWTNAKDEPWFPWLLFCVGSAINLLAVQNWEVKYYLYPVYMTLASGLISFPLVMYRLRLKRI